MTKTTAAATVISTTVQLDWISQYEPTKINSPTDQKGYDSSETTVGKLSTRRIQIFLIHFCLIHF